MRTTELVVELPEDEARALDLYAKEHGISIAELLGQYARDLRDGSRLPPHPANLSFTGKVPAGIDARETYREHIEQKHK